MSKSTSVLFMFHCPEQTGYAIASLEAAFHQAAHKAGYAEDAIFWSYNGLTDTDNPRKIACDYDRPDKARLTQFLRQHNIQVVMAFDLGYPSPVLPLLRQQGVKRVIAYWGASMSSLNHGIRLWIKQVEYRLRGSKPDHFIFESEAMRDTGVLGRGIARSATSIIYLGVDTHKFFPAYGTDFYAHDQLAIPRDRKLVFYSGHMEPRKGVGVIVNAARLLAEQNRLDDLHFVICGNKGDEAVVYQQMLENSAAESRVTFAGYRRDIAGLMRSAAVGVIASTGWDSFTMSSVEMMASGLPMVVSRLQGLAETIQENYNGYLVEPDNPQRLADAIRDIVSQPALAVTFSRHSRQRAETLFSVDTQTEKLARQLMPVREP